jgi:hypothetical protein
MGPGIRVRRDLRASQPSTPSGANVCATRGADPGATPAQRLSSSFDERAGGDEQTDRRGDPCMPLAMTLPVSASTRLRVFPGWENISRHTSLILDQLFEIAEVLFQSSRQTGRIESGTYF